MDLNKNKLFYSDIKSNEDGILFRYASDKRYGFFCLALNILEFDIKTKDFNAGASEFSKLDSTMDSDIEKLNIAKEIISNIIKK